MWGDPSGHSLPRGLLYLLYLLRLCQQPVSWAQLEQICYCSLENACPTCSVTAAVAEIAHGREQRRMELGTGWVKYTAKYEPNHKLASEILYLLCIWGSAVEDLG